MRVRRCPPPPAIVVSLSEKKWPYQLFLANTEHEQHGIETRAEREAKRFKLNPGACVDSLPGGLRRDTHTHTNLETTLVYVEELEALKSYTIPLTDLPPLCLEHVMSYIEDPKDLYSVTFSSKSMSELLSPEVVIRCAVFHNCSNKNKVVDRKKMSQIMYHVTNRAIHIPSAHRLLRLVNARRCERGADCWNRNLNSGLSGWIGSANVNRPFGMAICDKCIKQTTIKVDYSNFARHEKGCATHSGNLLSDPYHDKVTGDTVGPLIPALSIFQVDNTFSSRDDKKVALEGMVQKAMSDRSDFCPLLYEEKCAAYQEIFEEAEKECDDAVKTAQERKYEEYTERREAKILKRMTKIRKIYATLQTDLDDCPMKDLALACEWLEDDQRCIRFSTSFVQSKMSSIVSAPCSASQRSVQRVADEIRSILTPIHEKDFFSFGFIANSSNRFKKGIYQYVSEESTRDAIMNSTAFGDAQFMKAINDDKHVRALVRSLARISGALGRCFALSVVKLDPNQPEADQRIEDYRKLAKLVWSKKVPNQDVNSFTVMKENFTTSLEEWRIMKKNTRDYLSDPQTRAFLTRSNLVGGRANFTR